MMVVVVGRGGPVVAPVMMMVMAAGSYESDGRDSQNGYNAFHMSTW